MKIVPNQQSRFMVCEVGKKKYTACILSTFVFCLFFFIGIVLNLLIQVGN